MATSTAIVPEVEGPIATGVGAGPILPQPATPMPEGYTEDEFFIGGEATSYAPSGELATDGMWTAEPSMSEPYRTRVLVRRPPAAAFSGTVVVEWLNVTATEASPDWGYLVEEIGRAGHAYVAVSTQTLGVIGGESLLSIDIGADVAAESGQTADEADNSGLVNIDPERYGSLAHPGDEFAFDMYSQVGAALAINEGGLLGDLEPAQVIAIGESQSAGYLTTYVNAVHPLVNVYNGFLVHSRGAGGAPLVGGFGRDDDSSFTSEGHQIRTDLDVPVFMLQAETDLTLLGYSLARQDDTDLIRTWEVAGTAHADAHVIRGMIGGPRDPNVGSFLGCTNPINAGPHHEAVQAALNHLTEWAQGGAAPPTGERIQLVDGDPVAIARDELGRAIGGVRNPLVDVPIAIYSGDPWTEVGLDSVEEFDVCSLFGRSVTLDQAELLELHGSADNYVAAFTEAAEAAVDAGFLLQADADQLLVEAEENRALFG